MNDTDAVQVEARWEFGEVEWHSVGKQQQIVDAEGETVAWVECYEGDDANARKVVAAPDLLAALISISRIASRGDVNVQPLLTPIREAAMAAIAKATGHD